MRKGGHFGDVGRKEKGMGVRGCGAKKLKSKIRAAGQEHFKGGIYFPKYAFRGI